MAEAEGRLELAEDEIHVWSAALDLDDDEPAATLPLLAGTLSSDEAERAKRYLIEHVRRRFIVCRGILRTILGRYLGCAPARLRFTYGARGKPALAP